MDGCVGVIVDVANVDGVSLGMMWEVIECLVGEEKGVGKDCLCYEGECLECASDEFERVRCVSCSCRRLFDPLDLLGTDYDAQLFG